MNIESIIYLTKDQKLSVGLWCYNIGMNESESRIVINRLLEHAGWVFGQNVKTEAPVHDQERNIYKIDYLLSDTSGYPLCIVEAKASTKSPLEGKEQARAYARELRARYIILSNGEFHYFWDTESGNPKPISHFPTQTSLIKAREIKFRPKKLVDEPVDENYSNPKSK
jgi:type I restriction enzyme, R subunit